MPPKDPEAEKLKKELQDAIAKVQEDQKTKADTTLSEKCGDMGEVSKIRAGCKRMCKGHLNKVNSVHFSGDSRHLVSGSLDGKLIIWDIYTGNKTQIIPLMSAWVMSVAFSPSGNFVASGGMDNQCTVHDINNRDSTGAAKISRELMGYEGFLSSMRFLDDTNLITGSGDMKVIHWDVQTGKKVVEFFGHSGDVATMSLAPDMNCFVTGSVDRTIKVWDLRDTKTCKQTFWGHTSDVNSVYFHPSGFAIGSGSEDKTARMWDLRSDQQLAEYKPPTSNSGFTCCGLSKSGRYILCGSDDNTIHFWDTMKTTHQGTLQGHDNRITSLAVTDNGIGFATSSWDMGVRVWGL
ncbi:guanine nucleotide-binding protein subunit beta-2-like [Homarus americanus]|uniref:guanine nucleotide-binding protein subunit beta-2-like n=1 Tax=Homarus americanus TaxID=6706 RepID=UPI001C46A118|nr:guanine nucleotide-binding protein subunit beta-2-like [Homarus americanus]XP_042209105.1 guanine nucleotide-binding protein subunit beta-2-like [Homarus americanus]XP_042209106.1 guanine nucleotide-binding protein subunit beta-2-like [Homarus americanus]